MSNDYLHFYRQSLIRKANEKFSYNSPYQDVKIIAKINTAINEKVDEERQKIAIDNLVQIQKIKEAL